MVVKCSRNVVGVSPRQLQLLLDLVSNCVAITRRFALLSREVLRSRSLALCTTRGSEDLRVRCNSPAHLSCTYFEVFLSVLECCVLSVKGYGAYPYVDSRNCMSSQHSLDVRFADVLVL